MRSTMNQSNLLLSQSPRPSAKQSSLFPKSHNYRKQFRDFGRAPQPRSIKNSQIYFFYLSNWEGSKRYWKAFVNNLRTFQMSSTKRFNLHVFHTEPQIVAQKRICSLKIIVNLREYLAIITVWFNLKTDKGTIDVWNGRSLFFSCKCPSVLC